MGLNSSLYRIEIKTPSGWVTRTPTYESYEFALKDAQAEVKRFGDTLRVVEYTRTKTIEVAHDVG